MARTTPKDWRKYYRARQAKKKAGSSLLPAVIPQPTTTNSEPDAISFNNEPMKAVQNVDVVNAPRFWDNRGYQVNCQTCAWAFEANARGANVEATQNKGNRGNQDWQTYKDSYYNMVNDPEAFVQEFRSHKFGNTFWNEKAKATDVKNSILNETPDNARGMLRMSNWNSGHVINWVKENGKLKFYDAQIGKEVKITQLTNGATVTLNGRTFKTKSFIELSWARTDDKEMRPELMREYFKERK